MITSLIATIESALLPLGGVGVFAASLLEEVLAPIPSALVQMGAGFFLLPETVSGEFVFDLIVTVTIPAALGVTIGSLLVYFIAYYAGKPALERWGHWFGLSWSDVERGRERFQGGHKDSITLFVLRTIPIVPSVAISAVCGLIRMRLAKYFLYTFLGTLVRASGLAIVGWQLGELYHEYAALIDEFETYILVVLVVIVGGYGIYRFFWRGDRPAVR